MYLGGLQNKINNNVAIRTFYDFQRYKLGVLLIYSGKSQYQAKWLPQNIDKDNTNTLLRSSRDSIVHVNTFHIVTCLHLMETFSQALIDVLKV